MSRILVVDDEPSILATMVPLLRAHGYEVATAISGSAALDLIDVQPIHLVILDLGLPDLDGVEVCRRLRAGRSTPILILSARGAEQHKVAALDAGADDYITKPFGAQELLARVRAALRRSDSGASTPAGPIVRGDLTVDVERRRVTRGTEELRLTPKEFELLVHLIQRPGRVLTHRMILKAIWGPNAVDRPDTGAHRALRRKLEPDPGRPRYILTEPWVGYRFADL